MNRKEFVQIIATIKAAYPLSNTQFDDATMAVWYEMLNDLEFNNCKEAVAGYIKNNKYMPQISEIREACNKKLQALVKPYNEAWDDVIALVRKYGTYGTAEAMKELDPITKKVVKSIGFYNICTSTSIASVRKEFKELYNSYKEDADYDSNANKGNIAIEQK